METVKETIEWRLIAVIITFLITYLWTGKVLEATGLTIALNAVKTLAFYLYRKIKKGHLREHFRRLKSKN